MFEIVLILAAFIGSVAAGIIDLKTTEIPDEIPYVMIGIAIFIHLINALALKSYWPIALSFIVGLSFFAFGFLMYRLGQWGGGDAKLLSAIGFLLPTLPSQFTSNLIFPFPVSYFFNVFLIGAVYMFVYALVLSFQNKKVWSVFWKDFKSNSKMLVVLNIMIAIALLFFGFVAVRYVFAISLIDMIKFEIVTALAAVGLFMFWRFAKTVEEVTFKKRVRVSQLRVGDVLLDSRVWEGLTEEQLKKIKKSKKKYFWIKEGVRFGLTFPLALLFTFLIGDGILLLLNLL